MAGKTKQNVSGSTNTEPGAVATGLLSRPSKRRVRFTPSLPLRVLYLCYLASQ
jgi:hypothetical protein